MRSRSVGHAARLAILLLLPAMLMGRETAAAETVVAGMEGGGLWVAVPPGWGMDGFRLEAGASAAESRIVFPHDHGEAATIPVGGSELLRLRVEPADGGTALVVPLRLADLVAVERGPGGWQFKFTQPGSVLATVDASEYRLGARDVIEVMVFGHEDMNREETVPPGGMLNFPLAGEIQVAGRTPAEVEEDLENRLAADFLVDPQVTIRVKEYESQWVNVVGEVRNPGRFPIKGRLTVIDVITQAGGLTERAGPGILLSRSEVGGGVRQIRVEREDLFSAQNDAANRPLIHGDMVRVEKQAAFYIQGEVARPGSYALEKGATLLKAISIAGGFSQWADRKEVDLLREENGEQVRMVVNVRAIAERKQPDLDLKPEDIIIVKRRTL